MSHKLFLLAFLGSMAVMSVPTEAGIFKKFICNDPTPIIINVCDERIFEAGDNSTEAPVKPVNSGKPTNPQQSGSAHVNVPDGIKVQQAGTWKPLSDKKFDIYVIWEGEGVIATGQHVVKRIGDTVKAIVEAQKNATKTTVNEFINGIGDIWRILVGRRRLETGVKIE